MQDDTGRNDLVGVRITRRESEALARRVSDLKAEGRAGITKSKLAYDFMQNGGLKELVTFYFGSGGEVNPQNQGVE
jgi:hypothetical protein